MLTWLEEIKEVSSAGLTVQAQALSLDEIDPMQQLQHPVFAPYAPTDSVALRTIFETDKRFVADRREWNARGRYIPTVLPEMGELEMVPVESFDKIAERELQALNERAMGNEQTFRQLAMLGIPQRVDKLVAANYRRVELDFMEAWAKGTITVINPTKGGTAQTFSLGFDAGRLQTANTAWSDGGLNAYTELMSWIADGEAEMGPIVAVKLRRATFNEIQADAPNLVDYGANGIKATRRQIEERITDELGHAFRFIISEEQVDTFTDGGTAHSRTSVWPAKYVAAVPASGVIGATYRAPVARAFELARANPDAGIDVRGMTVYYEFENGGRTATIECQANWLGLPFERNVWTINAGV